MASIGAFEPTEQHAAQRASMVVYEMPPEDGGISLPGPATAPALLFQGKTVNAVEAKEFAEEWIAAWNAHDLDWILSHYADDFEMSSPYIVDVAGEPSGRLKGKSAVGAYWSKALAKFPDLRFELIDVLAGASSVAINYWGRGRRRACEVFFFDEHGRVLNAAAHYRD